MKVVLLLLLGSLDFILAQGQLEVHELGQFSYYEKQCIRELKLDEQMITEGLKKLYMPENNRDFNAFMECTWKKDGFIDDQGNIVFDRFYFYVKGAHMDAVGVSELAADFAEDTINHCREVQGATPGQTGVKLMNCILYRLYA